MLSEGTLLGRYRVDGLAAVGGMGAVYRGTDTLLERAVALKVLPADRAGDAGMAERFACESLQAAGLSHPNVLPVYDAGEAEGVSYVAMQWVDGATLEQLIVDEGPLDLERAADFTEAVAGALDHAHENGLVHRDVKPGNVMVDGDGNAYLMDFGLSVRTDRTSAVTRTGEFLATVDYAAPEQIEGVEVDRRADVYGLAGLAFRCLTGRVPFERDSPVARLYAHLNDEPPDAHELRPAVPPAVSETIRHGLAKRPEDRPQTAGAFAAELRAAFGGDTMPFAVMAAEPVAAAEPSAASRRTRRVLAGAAATVLAAFGGMSLAGITGGGSPSSDLPAADAGQRESRGAKTTATTTAAASSATPTTAGAQGEARKAKPAKKAKKQKERDEVRSEADGGLSGAGAGPGSSAGTPPAAPTPSASPASPAPAPSSPSGSAPTSSDTQPTQTQPSGTETTATQPSEPPPAETTPQTTPSEPPPAQTTPTETTPGG